MAAALLGSLALATASLSAPAVDPRPDPDACKLLSNLDLEPLLFAGAGGVLDRASSHPAPGLATCQWNARPKDHSADAVPRTVVLAFYHLADPARAQSQMDRQPHHDSRPSLAITASGMDAVVRPSPTVVFARHGADIAVINAAGAELDNPDQLEARYLLDALALKAAGAAVKPPPWAPTGAKPAWTPLADRAVSGWAPPPRPPRGGATMEPLAHAAHVVAGLRNTLTFVLAPIAALLIIFGGKSAPSGRRWWPMAIGLVLLAFMIGNSLVGTGVANALIERYGEAGAATVTGTFATNTQYNRRDVVGNRVLIRTIDGRTVSAEFRTDDFNVRPAQNAVSYPGPGDVFTVDYLPHHPADFVIRADDASPWAKRLACGRLDAWRAEAERRSGFSPADATPRAERDRAQAAERAADCPAG